MSKIVEWINKMPYIYMYIYIHTHTCIYRDTQMEHYSTMKKWTHAICNNMNGHGGYYAYWNKSDKDKNCVISLKLGVKKIQQTSVCNKKEASSQMQGTN